jgi:hypothetical protein
MGSAQEQGYQNQFERGWEIINPEQPMTGRVVTAQFMPLRPDLEKYIKEKGKLKDGHSRVEQIHGPLMSLLKVMYMSPTAMAK